jgi:hypothetical protein
MVHIKLLKKERKMAMYKDIYSNFYYNYSPELYHHGVKGQKHGHRRWQNPDGSLTPAGREHYGVGMKRAKRLAGVGMVTAGAGMVNAGLLAAKKASTAKEIKNLGKATTVVSEAEKIGGTPNSYAAAKIWTAGRAAELTRELLTLPALSSPAVVAPIAIGGAAALAGLGYIGYKKYQQYKANKGTSVKHCDLSEFDEDTLCHFGIRDMHWGVRRWQNPDGSLTPEGYEHYGINPNDKRTFKEIKQSQKIQEKIIKSNPSVKSYFDDGYEIKNAKSNWASKKVNGIDMEVSVYKKPEISQSTLANAKNVEKNFESYKKKAEARIKEIKADRDKLTHVVVYDDDNTTFWFDDVDINFDKNGKITW